MFLVHGLGSKFWMSVGIGVLSVSRVYTVVLDYSVWWHVHWTRTTHLNITHPVTMISTQKNNHLDFVNFSCCFWSTGWGQVKSWMSVGMGAAGVCECVYDCRELQCVTMTPLDTYNTSKNPTPCHYDIQSLRFLCFFWSTGCGEFLNECWNGCFRCLHVCIWLPWATVCEGMYRGHIQHT